MIKQTLLGISASATIPPGTLVGGRFLLGPITTMMGLIAVHDSRDQKTQRPVSLWMIPPNIMSAENVELTRKAIRGAAAVAHKDLVVPFGSSVMPDGTLCVATEPVGSTSVGDLISKKRADKAVHALSAAYPLVAHVTNALTVAHASLAHGAVCPNLVRIDPDGKVKLAGLGLLTPLISFGATQSIYIAPEVRKGGTPTAQSDIYSVGALLYELLTGEAVNPAVPPSQLVPGLGATLDIIVESCLAEDPAERFESAEALKGALAALVAPTARPAAHEGLDIDIEFDEDAIAANATPHEPRPITLAPGKHSVGPSPSVPPRQSEGDLNSLLTAVTRNDSDRWMFSHDGLDHGPITARDLIAAVLRGDVDESDAVLNMETGEKKRLLDWPQYREFAETASDKRKTEARKANAVAAIQDEGVKKASRSVIAATALVMIAMIGGVYWKTLGPGATHTRTAHEIDDLVQRGELTVQTRTIQLLPPPPPSPTHHGGGGGGGGGGGSYEAAMSAPIDYNFGAAGGAGGGTLNDAEIVRPLNASLGRFAGCLSDGSARQVTLRLAIGGSGRAIGVTVVNGSGAVKSCVAGVVRSLNWRAFGGPRIGLSWGFGF